MTSTRPGRAFAVLPPLTHELAEVIPAYAAAVAPLAEQVAHTLARTSPGKINLSAPLSPANITNAQTRGKRSANRRVTGISATTQPGLRPRPLATAPNLARPCSANRFRHASTVDGETPTCAAMPVFARPCPASSSARARCTSRCRAVRDLLRLSKISRWLSVNGIGALAGRIAHPTAIPCYFGDTTLGGTGGVRRVCDLCHEVARHHFLAV